MSAILILNYHRLTEPRDLIDPRFLSFTLAKDDFEQQLALIRQLGIPVTDLAHPERTDPEAPLSVAFTFDDGHASDLQLAVPALRSYGFPAAFFPVTDLIGREGYLHWSELAAMYQQGFTIGSHSLSHRLLHRLTPDELQREVNGSKQLLEERLGNPVDFFAIPYGRATHAVTQAICDAGYEQAFSTEFGFNPADDYVPVMKRWNIRRTTTVSELRQVLQQRLLPVARLHIRSSIRKQIDRVTNRLYPT